MFWVETPRVWRLQVHGIPEILSQSLHVFGQLTEKDCAPQNRGILWVKSLQLHRFPADPLNGTWCDLHAMRWHSRRPPRNPTYFVRKRRLDPGRGPGPNNTAIYNPKADASRPNHGSSVPPFSGGASQAQLLGQLAFEDMDVVSDLDFSLFMISLMISNSKTNQQP